MNRRGFVLFLSLVVCACGPDAGLGDAGPPGDAQGCSTGATRCEGLDLLVCGAGDWTVRQTCPNACTDGLGCTFCTPGTGLCNGEISRACVPDGSRFVDTFCDPLLGLGCNVDSGLCDGPCAPQNLGKNYIGCEYFPTVTATSVRLSFSYAVAVSNTSTTPANVHIEGGALTAPLMFTVAPDSVDVRNLPWVPALKACNIRCPGINEEPSSLTVRGAYHLRSDRPVTVYQFNPLDYVAGAQNSYTNDASLLLPTNSMTGNYRVASYSPWLAGTGVRPAFMTVTATQDDTRVEVTSTAATEAGNGIAAFAPGTPQTLTLNKGDVAQMLAIGAPQNDPTGSLIAADKPVQVIGGHYCTQIPHGIPACDHIEESMFPIETLDAEYIVAAPAVPALPNGKVRIVRIVGIVDNTSLSYDPMQVGAPLSIARAGDFVEIIGTRETFKITADHKILVAQYMEGEAAEGGTGDPAVALAVPLGQYRTDYQFHAPQNYLTLYVNIIAPTGATITLDGTVLGGFTSIGTTGFDLLRHQLPFQSSGTYKITGSDPFGITVYGYGDWTSFYYPGGLDLAPIIVD